MASKFTGTTFILCRRHHGVHRPVRRVRDATPYAQFVRGKKVDEDRVLAELPPDFLPVPAKDVLLMLGTEWGSEGLTSLSRFHNWAKYFDAYSLEIRDGE